MNHVVELSGFDLSLTEIVEVSRNGAKVRLTDQAGEQIRRSRAVVAEREKSAEPTYGISTGFGELSDVRISPEQNGTLQRNLILSHACAVGEPFPEDIVRASMLLRLNTLAGGYSGVSLEVAQLLLELLNRGITPYIPQQGSLGASGDLANLAHMSLVLLGEGNAWYEGNYLSGAEALTRAGLKPVVLSGKDGLALINGTPIETAQGALALHDGENCLRAANLAAALSAEALQAFSSALDPRMHHRRPHPGQIATATYLRKVVEGSTSIDSDPNDIQDAYALRCVPQVHGAVADALAQVRRVVEIEINSVTDNPLVFEDEVISGGNFHGEPIAINMDYLAVAVSELASISERRIARLVDPALNKGLPAFLVTDGGVNSGFMIPQYTAACLVAENKVLSHPASVDSIPTSANKEDHVSMGALAARKADQVVKNTRQVLAIEWVCAAQGVDLRKVERLGKGTAEMQRQIRSQVAFYEQDRYMQPDLLGINEWINDEHLDRIEQAAGLSSWRVIYEEEADG